ncbi:hypothetical protein Lal_00047668 [Lupinus albus]|uniref:Pectinesterase n=1 Tax=Lupinus albus TaxID=3870 RepID=A0A6A4QYP1_LUPAL|nr:putative pectinesterase [Lupinus albus]KAF1878996.1 hypothetical protein Lal_00047668 [Lupinus albus]
MELLSRAILLHILLFVSSSFWANIVATSCEGNKVISTIVVDQSGKTKFKTVQSAIDSINENNNQWVKIQINAGTYKEKVQIPYTKPCIYLEGRSRSNTIITYNAHKQTDESATFSSFPDNVIARSITFHNSYNINGKTFSSQNGTIVLKPGQVVPALAARIYGDKSAFYDCNFIGFQDTLWDVQGRHYFKDCRIEGSVDFIFGNGQSYYQNCVLNALSSGFVTAQGRCKEEDPSGFVFRGGSVNARAKTLLGRAYGKYSRVIFHGTHFSPKIQPEGWSSWQSNSGSGTTYIEADCEGPGADTSKRVPWSKKVSGSKMDKFSISSFINQDGWLQKLPVKWA